MLPQFSHLTLATLIRIFQDVEIGFLTSTSPALDLTSFEWTYVLPYARINFPFILPSICLKDMGKTKLIREATCEGHISCCLRGITIRKRGMYSQYSRRNLGSIICLASPHVRASVMDHGQ